MHDNNISIPRNICPICKQRMSRDLNSNNKYYHDFLCKGKEDHFFASRIQDGKVTKIKVKILDDDYYLFMKVNFDENNTQVWRKKVNAVSDDNRVQVEHAREIDLSSKDKIKNKIKTYLLFS